MGIRPADRSAVDPIVDLAAALFAEDGGTRDPHLDPDWPRRVGHAYYAAALEDPDSLVVTADADGVSVVGFLVGRLR